ncbi:MAG: hypothetical protein QF473_41215, partial [Planctomycetota bacterium]|nr:hypothetical protein [Planctomycetota bacterium]
AMVRKTGWNFTGLASIGLKERWNVGSNVVLTLRGKDAGCWMLDAGCSMLDARCWGLRSKV